MTTLYDAPLVVLGERPKQLPAAPASTSSHEADDLAFESRYHPYSDDVITEATVTRAKVGAPRAPRRALWGAPSTCLRAFCTWSGTRRRLRWLLARPAGTFVQ